MCCRCSAVAAVAAARCFARLSRRWFFVGLFAAMTRERDRLVCKLISVKVRLDYNYIRQPCVIEFESDGFIRMPGGFLAGTNIQTHTGRNVCVIIKSSDAVDGDDDGDNDEDVEASGSMGCVNTMM